MTSTVSLEELLQSLINTPEVEKSALVQAVVKSLREACNLFHHSSSPVIKNNAHLAVDMLDRILADSQLDEEEWEEEFAESNPDFDLQERNEGASSTSRNSSASVSSVSVAEDSPSSSINKTAQEWNALGLVGTQLPKINLQKPQEVVDFVKTASSIRSNLSCYSSENEEKISKFDQIWKDLLREFRCFGYEITPSEFGSLDGTLGHTIYTCRTRANSPESELVVPGISYQGDQIASPVSLMVLPPDTPFPTDHPDQSFSSHWRGVLGELELLAQHVEMQPDAYSAIEGINKNKVEPLEETKTAVLNEIKRRGEVLRTTIGKEDETLYRLATDYWRVEECFWSIFHDDERASYFDRLRANLQSWRATLRRVAKFSIRDFSCHNDTLASVNKYIGNIILHPQKGVAPGTVIRELRPAILVKVQATSRLLKGRAIAT